MNYKYYQCFKDEDVSEINSVGQKWYRSLAKEKVFNVKVVNELLKHQQQGGDVVLVSGSFSACLSPIASELNIQEILSVRLQIANGRYTGDIIPPQTIGMGKAEAIKDYLSKKDFHDYECCYAYGDHTSDIPMLSLVGNPVVIYGGPVLEKYAKQKNWRIIYS